MDKTLCPQNCRRTRMDYWHTSLHYTWRRSNISMTIKHEAQIQLLSNTMSNKRTSQVKGCIIGQNAYILRLNRILHFLNRHNRIWTHTVQSPTNLVSTILHKWSWTVFALSHFRNCDMTSSFNVWAAIPRKPERPKKRGCLFLLALSPSPTNIVVRHIPGPTQSLFLYIGVYFQPNREQRLPKSKWH